MNIEIPWPPSPFPTAMTTRLAMEVVRAKPGLKGSVAGRPRLPLVGQSQSRTHTTLRTRRAAALTPKERASPLPRNWKQVSTTLYYVFQILHFCPVQTGWRNQAFFGLFPQLSPNQVGETLSFSENSLSLLNIPWVYSKEWIFFPQIPWIFQL